jgi:pimeloyl-ACP methyl ester carboxylesterase
LSSASITQSVHPQRANDKVLIGRIREIFEQVGHEVFARRSLLVRDDIAPCDIQCSTLIIVGAQDKLRLPEEAHELRDAIPGAESGLMILGAA